MKVTFCCSSTVLDTGTDWKVGGTGSGDKISFKTVTYLIFFASFKEAYRILVSSMNNLVKKYYHWSSENTQYSFCPLSPPQRPPTVAPGRNARRLGTGKN